MTASPGKVLLCAFLSLPALCSARLNVLEEDANLTSRWELSNTH